MWTACIILIWGTISNILALAQDEAAARLMRTGIAGNHGWSIVPLCDGLTTSLPEMGRDGERWHERGASLSKQNF